MADRVLADSCNVVSAIYAGTYFPTHSNGLKHVGAYVGFTWSEGNASGAQSVAWRRAWESGGANSLKQKLITDNAEDCATLRRVPTRISRGSPPRLSSFRETPSEKRRIAS
jgi:predicted RecB family nuclease